VAAIVVIGTRDSDGGAEGASPPDATEPGGAVPPDLGDDDQEADPGPSGPPYPEDEGEGVFETEILEGQTEGAVAADGGMDTYRVPLPGDRADPCPRQVEILLETQGDLPLQLTVTRNREVVFQQVSGNDGAVRYDLRPADCGSQDIQVIVRVPEGVGEVPPASQRYVLRRTDTI
jgi:hypothetical protein